jgi:hypothetical protein
MPPGRRSCALVVVLALLTAGPLAAPRGCVDCPPGCPMHARRADGPEKRPHLGCHRGRVPASGEACLRSACGHDASSRTEAAIHAVLRGPVHVQRLFAASRVAPEDVRLASSSPPEPPTDPPRALQR